MKKLLLFTALALGSSVHTSANAASTFSASQMEQVKIRELSFKEVMRGLYGGQMVSVSVDDESIEDIPNIGLAPYKFDDYNTVALMHPVISYYNTVGKRRYLLIIEKVNVKDGSIDACHGCGAKADLFSFKKLENGLFQLVSRTPKKTENLGRYGRINLNMACLERNMGALGSNLTGVVFTDADRNMGEEVERWIALHLPEDEFINFYDVGDAGANNSGQYDEESPLHYSYKSNIDIIVEDTKYYPIMLTFKGEMPDDIGESIEPVNFSKIIKFNPIKNQYQ